MPLHEEWERPVSSTWLFARSVDFQSRGSSLDNHDVWGATNVELSRRFQDFW